MVMKKESELVSISTLGCLKTINSFDTIFLIVLVFYRSFYSLLVMDTVTVLAIFWMFSIGISALVFSKLAFQHGFESGHDFTIKMMELCKPQIAPNPFPQIAVKPRDFVMK